MSQINVNFTVRQIKNGFVVDGQDENRKRFSVGFTKDAPTEQEMSEMETQASSLVKEHTTKILEAGFNNNEDV